MAGHLGAVGFRINRRTIYGRCCPDRLYRPDTSPIHDLGEHYLFSAHMFQHFCSCSLVAAPLLVLGLPVGLMKADFENRLD